MFLKLWLAFYAFAVCNALECATCTHIASPTICTNYTQCQNGDECLGGSSSSLVGRSVEQVICNQCCAKDRCNQYLCSVGTQVINEVGTCADDPKYNCQQVSSAFNICSDVQHAKVVCRSFCGLCNLVDGAWGLWSPWSACDVTCGTGTLTRTRTCTDPQPAHGGLHCNGRNTDVKPCNLNLCPIHGGWGSWQSWSSCSHTCSIGTQSRHRSCDSPIPQLAGNHCFGDPVDFRSCFLRSCSDGNWSSWSNWTTCVHNMRTRSRTCDNPRPSQLGKACVGNNEENIGCTATVAFTVTTPNRTFVDGRPIFTNIVTNVGGRYDPNTAKFTCPIAGLYMFTFTLRSDGNSFVFCYITKNGADVSYTITNGRDEAASTSIYLQLAFRDVVNLSQCSNWNHVSPSVITSFSGALVGS